MELLFLRGIERLAAVVIGGMAIYLGYRLFIAINVDADGEARINLPGDVTVMLSRVGPGVFFALFGTVIVSASLYFSISYKEINPASANGTEKHVSAIGGLGQERDESAVVITTSDQEAIALDRTRLLQEVAFLNSIPDILRADIEVQERDDIEWHIRKLKLRLMESVWADDWGDPKDFRIWAEGGAPARDDDAFRSAQSFYNMRE